MTSAQFDFAPLLPAGLPAPAARWTGLAKYSFVGGNNDPDQVPVDELADAVNAVLRREGRTLATYGLASGPQGYRPLREFLTTKLKRDAGIDCAADDILIVSGSLQALDLVNATLLARGDTIITEQDTYQGALNRLTRLGVNMVGIPLDEDGMRMDALAEALADLKAKGITPKYIYTIPTVQNPTGTIMPESRRAELLKLSQQYGVPIFEDDCYADLIWDGKRPPAIYAMDKTAGVIHIGSFSKSIAPALRVGYIVAPWAMLSRMLALKTDAGSGALEQMVLAEYCAPHFATHVPKLNRGLRAKLETLMEALNEQFGTSAEFEDPKGGIFLWVKLPDNVDTLKLYQAALAAGVAINPGPEWSTDKAYAGSRLRLCFASPSHEQIREGVAVLAEVCRKEFGVPAQNRECGEARRGRHPSPHGEERVRQRPCAALRASRTIWHIACCHPSRRRAKCARLLRMRSASFTRSEVEAASAAVPHSLLMPASAISLPHLALSLWMNCAKASAEDGAGSAPRMRIFSIAAGSFRAFTKAAFSLLMISGGVAAGATMPNQPTDSNPLRPCSESGGTSGKNTTGLAADTPSAFSFPSRINCRDAGISSTASGM